MALSALATCPLFTPPALSLSFSDLPFPSSPSLLSLSLSSDTKLSLRLSTRPLRRLSAAKSSGYRPEEDDALDISSLRSDNVRLIDEQQNMVGVVSKNRALQMADEAELDLVVLSPDADPPVVRIMNYDKYRYEQQKKKREQQKKSAASRMDLKELKMGYNIDVHDYTVRLKAAKKFLNDGDKVKIIVNLKGREKEFRDMAINLIKKFQTDVGELATEESKMFREKMLLIVMVPNKALKAPETLNKKDKEPAPVSPNKKDKEPANEVLSPGTG